MIKTNLKQNFHGKVNTFSSIKFVINLSILYSKIRSLTFKIRLIVVIQLLHIVFFQDSHYSLSILSFNQQNYTALLTETNQLSMKKNLHFVTSRHFSEVI